MFLDEDPDVRIGDFSELFLVTKPLNHKIAELLQEIPANQPSSWLLKACEKAGSPIPYWLRGPLAFVEWGIERGQGTDLFLKLYVKNDLMATVEGFSSFQNVCNVGKCAEGSSY